MALIQSLIEHGMWPLASVIIALAALLMFRGSISGLLNRTKKIGAGNNAIDFAEPKTTELQQIQAQPTTNQLSTNYSLAPPSAAVAEIERQVIQLLSSSNEGDDAKRHRLIRGAAVLALQRDFEVIYRLIFGSQLDLLLRANAGGFDEAGADALYRNARGMFPAVHESGSFEMWLSFLVNRQLIERKSSRILVTQKGKEFMQYLVEVGLTTPKGG
jgi:hypothetical protein